MTRMNLLRRIRDDRRAGISMLSALSLTMAIGAAALAVDLGALYLDRRKLQGIADAAALAAAARPGGEEAAVARVIAVNCDCGIRLKSLARGRYRADVAIPAEQRFVAGDASANAVRLTLEHRRPLFFGRFLTGRPDSMVHATATGARRGYAAFSLGSRVAAVHGGVPNALLSALTGSEVNLSVMDYEALASADIDLLAFSDALRTEIDADALTFGETLDSQVTTPQILSALAAASDGQAAAILEGLASNALPRSLAPSRAIDLGPRASSIRVDAADAVQVNALSLLRALLFLGNANRQLDLSVAGALPGGSGIDVALIIGEPPAHSPLIAVTDDEEVIVRTAQARLKIDARVATPLASVHVPLVAELGSASARITDIDCQQGDGAGVSLAVTTSPASLAIGTVDAAAFQDMQQPLDPKPARLLKLPLASVDGGAELMLSDMEEQSIRFARADIDAGRTQTVSSHGLVAGAAASLAERIDLKVNVLGLGLNAGTLTSLVGNTLATTAPVLDGVLEGVTGMLGLHLGEADARVNALRCGRAKLV